MAYHLTLVTSMRVHFDFYMSLLELYKDSTYPRYVWLLPLCVKLNNHEEFEIKEILDLKVYKNKLKYFIHLQRYSISKQTWKLATQLNNISIKIKEFYQHHLSKPK